MPNIYWKNPMPRSEMPEEGNATPGRALRWKAQVKLYSKDHSTFTRLTGTTGTLQIFGSFTTSFTFILNSVSTDSSELFLPPSH